MTRISLLFFLLFTGVAFANTTLPVEITEYFGLSQSETLEKLSSAEGRSEILQSTLAVEFTDIESASKIWTLAIDLYQTIPQGVVSTSIDGYLDTRSWFYDVADLSSVLTDNAQNGWTLAKYLDRIDRYKRRGRSTEALYLKIYSLWYLRNSGIRLEAPQTNNIKPIESVDISNPTHYKTMSTWMASMATAMEQDISPDKAEEWTLAHCNDWGGCDGLEFESEKTDEAPETDDTAAYDDTTEAVGHIGNVVKSPEPESSPLERDEKPGKPLLVWGALGAVVLFGLSVGLFAIFRGRRKPD